MKISAGKNDKILKFKWFKISFLEGPLTNIYLPLLPIDTS